jgi:hypothetical protein
LVKAARSARLSAVHDGAAALSGEGCSPALFQKGGSEVAKKNYAVLLWRWHDIALIPNMKRPFQ